MKAIVVKDEAAGKALPFKIDDEAAPAADAREVSSLRDDGNVRIKMSDGMR
jgi:hypothetical protein